MVFHFYLMSYGIIMALLLISHDRAVLGKLVTTIWEISEGSEGSVHVYTGNYSEYMEQKQLEREQQNQAQNNI